MVFLRPCSQQTRCSHFFSHTLPKIPSSFSRSSVGV